MLNENYQLSTDINIITAEINAYQRVAGEAIFEIGKRLKHVKENDLVHGEFGMWLDTMNFDRTAAKRMMRIVDELDDSKSATLHHLGVSALFEIAQLPEAERDKTHTLHDGSTKTPEDMTVRELREVKRLLKNQEEYTTRYSLNKSMWDKRR